MTFVKNFFIYMFKHSTGLDTIEYLSDVHHHHIEIMK